MKQIVVLVRDIPDEKGEAWIDESPGTTAFGFYPIRDLLYRQGQQFPAGELILADDEGKVKYHRVINMRDSIINTVAMP